MSCVTPLESKKEKNNFHETMPISENKISLKQTVLGTLNHLISENGLVLEHTESLLKDNYYDRRELLKMLSLDSKEILMKFLNEWSKRYSSMRTETCFNRIVDFSNYFAKEGKIIVSLKFLIIFKRQFTSLFETGEGSFSELQRCYEELSEFQKKLKSSIFLFSSEVDALLSWLEENQDTLKSSENITAKLDFKKLYCNKKTISNLLELIELFSKDLQARLIKAMIIDIDTCGRALDLHPSCDLSFEGSGNVLLEYYFKNPNLRKKLDYVAFLCKGSLAFELELLENNFQTVVRSAQRIDKGLVKVKRISYLCQGLDRRVIFCKGFCAGDSVNWCQTILLQENQNLKPILIDKFDKKEQLHCELVSENVYRLQMKYMLGREESIYLGRLSGGTKKIGWVENLSNAIFELMRHEANKIELPNSFEVYLGKKDAHLISFHQFFRKGVEYWRMRDLNYGEFEGTFEDLKEWFPRFYISTFYITDYDEAVLKKLINHLEKIDNFYSDEQLRKYFSNNVTLSVYYSLFSDELYEEALKIHKKIIEPTMQDDLLKNMIFALHYTDKVFSNPKKVMKALKPLLVEFSDLKISQQHTFKIMAELTYLIASFNDNQSEKYKNILDCMVSEIDLELLKIEDAKLVKLVTERYKGNGSAAEMQLTKEQLEAYESILVIYAKTLEDDRFAIKKILEELQKSNLKENYSRGILKRLTALLSYYKQRCSAIITYGNKLVFDNINKFEIIGVEENLNPLLVKEMDRFIHVLSMAEISRPLVYRKNFETENVRDEILWKTWKKTYNQRFPKRFPEEKNNKGYGPGAIVLASLFKYRAF
jgi:hypothetical protein